MPVIDRAAGTIFLITYTYESSVPTFRLHAIDISTLLDKVPPIAIGGIVTLSNGRALQFVSAHNRQRAGPLPANGNIYPGFASRCDINSDVSRGW
jgi:hypothetical protein